MDIACAHISISVNFGRKEDGKRVSQRSVALNLGAEKQVNKETEELFLDSGLKVPDV